MRSTRFILLRALCAAALLLPALAGLLRAQDMTPEQKLALQRERARIGLFGSLGLNIQSSNFAGIPEALSCMESDGARFTGGSGLGPGFGLLFELPFSASTRLGLRASMQVMDSKQTAQAYLGPVVLPSGDTASGISEYSLDMATMGFELELGFGFKPVSSLPLWLRIGPEIGISSSRDYTQQEQIISPSGATFVGPNGENTRVRNAVTTTLGDTPFRIAAVIGGEYELPLNREETFILSPGIDFAYGFTPVRSDLDWNAHQLRASLALKYSFPVPPPPPPPDTTPVVIKPPPPEPILTSALRAVGVGADNVERPNVTVRIEEFVNTETRSMLNYVFFDQGSSTIPDRYVRISNATASSFTISQLHDQTTIDVYHQVLNVVGSRMKSTPGSTITLTGTNDGTDAEKGVADLSRSRAEGVKNYLTTTWGIDPGRIKVVSRNLPGIPSNPTDPDGMAENRRVEITSENLTLLEPVTTDDTLRRADPPMLRLKPAVNAEAGAERWELTIAQGGRTLKQFSGNGEPPTNVDWAIAETREALPLQQRPLVSTLTVRDKNGKTTQATTQTEVTHITVEQKRDSLKDDVVYDRINLITFDFDKATLDRTNQRIAAGIKQRIKPNSTVEIVGYTDRLGDEERNMKLSTDRALNTAKVLGVSSENARGAGENTTMYDNDLPEGRFYSRTVDIRIATPVNR